MTKTFFHRCCVALLSAMIAISSTGTGAVSEFSRAWKSPNSSIVLDAYEYTVIDWSKIKNNQRLAGFINKATEGLRPRSSCGRNSVCRLRWRRYSAAKELYHTRKTLAKTLGLKWGAYHLGRPGNPIKQARHFLEFAKPGPDDLIAIDIEENNPKRWMSLKEAEVFSQYIYEKLGRYPVLYTNHTTARHIARNSADLPLLSRLNLWYARYRPSMKRAFPMGNWDSYTIWQFSAHTNCSPQSCLWRIDGTDHWIDVNVVNMHPDELRQKWPFNELTARMPSPAKPEKTNHLPQFVADAVRAQPQGEVALAALTGYAEKPKVVSAAKIFQALLSKPRMALRGEVPLPNWRPVTKVAAATDIPVATQPKTPVKPEAAQATPTIQIVEQPKEPKAATKEVVAQTRHRHTQQVNALLLETVKSYLTASRNGRADWSTSPPVSSLTPPVMAAREPVATPRWRPGDRLAEIVPDVEPAAEPQPVVAPVMMVKGKVALPNWRPDARVAQVEPAKPLVEVAPKMAVRGLVATPRWRPGAKIRRLAQNSSSEPFRVASTSSYALAISAGSFALNRTTTPTWRPDSI